MKKQHILLLVATAVISNSINATSTSSTIQDYVKDLISSVTMTPQAAVTSQTTTSPQGTQTTKTNVTQSTSTVSAGNPSNINITGTKEPVVIKTTEQAANYSELEQ